MHIIKPRVMPDQRWSRNSVLTAFLRKAGFMNSARSVLLSAVCQREIFCDVPQSVSLLPGREEKLCRTLFSGTRSRSCLVDLYAVGDKIIQAGRIVSGDTSAGRALDDSLKAQLAAIPCSGSNTEVQSNTTDRNVSDTEPTKETIEPGGMALIVIEKG